MNERLNDMLDRYGEVCPQKKAAQDYTDRDKWLRMAVMNTACSGGFTSDRTIRQYNDLIWHLTPLEL